MGLRCLFTSLTGEVFGRGVMSAFFHEVGRRRSKKEEFKMSATGAANKSAFSFNTHEGIPSGPDALFVLSADSFLKTENSDKELESFRNYQSIFVHFPKTLGLISFPKILADLFSVSETTFLSIRKH